MMNVEEVSRAVRAVLTSKRRKKSIESNREEHKHGLQKILPEN
jgi:hypothetical protein